jgi:hypothetical protein
VWLPVPPSSRQLRPVCGGGRPGVRDLHPAPSLSRLRKDGPASGHIGFSPGGGSHEAVHLIHQFTKGIPRRINNVATDCLLEGFVEQKTLIDESTAKKALGEFQDDLGG